MKVLFVGELIYGATSKMRMQQFEKLGHEVKGIDICRMPKMGFFIKNAARVSWRMGWPMDLSQINQCLLDSAKIFRPDMLWVDKGVVVKKTTLEIIKYNLPSIKLVHYNPDDPFGHFGKSGWRTFISAIRAYDAHFVPRKQNVSEYLAHGAKRVFYNVPTRGFDPEIHRPYSQKNDIRKLFAADVGFLGSYEKERMLALSYLADSGISIRLAADWPTKYWHKNYFRANFGVRGQEYAKAIGSFKIGLGFLRKANRDQHTSRSIEIPACGTFLLAERTEEHRMLFEEGKEAEFFSSNEEMKDKIRFYLFNSHARNKIARAGRQRCLKSGYDYGCRMKTMIKQVME